MVLYPIPTFSPQPTLKSLFLVLPLPSPFSWCMLQLLLPLQLVSPPILSHLPKLSSTFLFFVTATFFSSNTTVFMELKDWVQLQVYLQLCMRTKSGLLFHTSPLRLIALLAKKRPTQKIVCLDKSCRRLTSKNPLLRGELSKGLAITQKIFLHRELQTLQLQINLRTNMSIIFLLRDQTSLQS